MVAPGDLDLWRPEEAQLLEEALATAALFTGLHPNVLRSDPNPANSLTVANASSSHYTLTVMSIAALCFTPVVLAYQAWTYWVFRRRLTVDDVAES